MCAVWVTRDSASIVTIGMSEVGPKNYFFPTRACPFMLYSYFLVSLYLLFFFVNNPRASRGGNLREIITNQNNLGPRVRGLGKIINKHM